MATNTLINYTLPNSRGVANEQGRMQMIPGFPENDFRTGLIGTSDCNVFIPAIAVMNHELLDFEGIRVLEYSMPVASSRYGSFRQYDRLIDSLFRASYPAKFDFKVAGVQHSVYAHRGILYDYQGNILMCLAVETEYALTIPVNQPRVQEYFDPTKYVLFITPEFDNPTYKNLRKKIETMYIDNCRGLNMDIIYTSRINNWLFKNNFVAPTFRNIGEMNKHLKEEVPKNLLMI